MMSRSFNLDAKTSRGMRIAGETFTETVSQQSTSHSPAAPNTPNKLCTGMGELVAAAAMFAKFSGQKWLCALCLPRPLQDKRCRRTKRAHAWKSCLLNTVAPL